MKKEILTVLVTSLGFSGLANAACSPVDCAALGYTKTEAACNGSSTIRCPFDVTKVNCVKKALNCSVGDIFYSDNTCSADVVSGKTPVGVVGYVTDSGTQGTVISLEEKSDRWSILNSSLLSCGPDAKYENRHEYVDGISNTQCIMSESNAAGTYPAASYCVNYTPVSSGKGSSGWYLPAYGEMLRINSTVNLLNNTLQRLSKTKISENNYWSSTILKYNYALAFQLNADDVLNGFHFNQFYLNIRCMMQYGNDEADTNAGACKGGDIYYSDGTCDASVVSGKTPIGVVAYVTDGGKHGKILALKENASNWSNAYSDLSNCMPVIGDINLAQQYVDGKKDTECLMSSEAVSYPAARYCSEYSAVSNGVGNSGWYLPSVGELVTAHSSYDEMNASLAKLSQTKINSWYYWSSTDREAISAWCVEIIDGNTNSSFKKSGLMTRCMLEF